MLQAQGKVKEAQASYRQALTLNPNAAQTHSNLLFCLNYTDDLSADKVYAMHRGWEEQHGLTRITTTYANDLDTNRRLRVGYVSPDFREHSVAYFAEPVLSAHDPHVVEVFAYADVATPDAVTERFKRSCSWWRDIAKLNDEQVAKLVHADKIDVLVDLAGHTTRNRLGVFSAKPAPVQLNFIGYPNTTGLRNIDYRLTDAWADPVGETEGYHTEELIRLENGFFVLSTAATTRPMLVRCPR